MIRKMLIESSVHFEPHTVELERSLIEIALGEICVGRCNELEIYMGCDASWLVSAPFCRVLLRDHALDHRRYRIILLKQSLFVLGERKGRKQ